MYIRWAIKVANMYSQEFSFPRHRLILFKREQNKEGSTLEIHFFKLNVLRGKWISCIIHVHVD